MPADRDFLNKLQIASPCPAAWAEMNGDDRARFCATCEKHVYDFSKMTAAEGVALVREKEGKVCGRLWRRADGTVITADCQAGARRVTRRGSAWSTQAAATILAVALLNVACAAKRPPQAAPVASSTPIKRVQPAMTTTYDSSGPVPLANVTIRDWVAGADTMTVGNMVNFDDYGHHLDFDSPTTGLRLTPSDWEHLPLK